MKWKFKVPGFESLLLLAVLLAEDAHHLAWKLAILWHVKGEKERKCFKRTNHANRKRNWFCIVFCTLGPIASLFSIARIIFLLMFSSSVQVDLASYLNNDWLWKPTAEPTSTKTCDPPAQLKSNSLIDSEMTTECGSMFANSTAGTGTPNE